MLLTIISSRRNRAEFCYSCLVRSLKTTKVKTPNFFNQHFLVYKVVSVEKEDFWPLKRFYITLYYFFPKTKWTSPCLMHFDILSQPASCKTSVSCVIYLLSLKIENVHWAERTTTTCCGIIGKPTTWNILLWLFLNNRNALWHVKICHDAKFVSWLLK